jgi:hypothetical protein
VTRHRDTRAACTHSCALVNLWAPDVGNRRYPGAVADPPAERTTAAFAGTDVLHGVPKLLFTVTETSDPGSGDSVRRIGEAYGHTVFATRNAVTQKPANCSPEEALKLRFIRLLIATMLALTIMSFAPAVQASTDPEATSFNSAGTARPVAPFDNYGNLGGFHPTPREFHNQLMNTGPLRYLYPDYELFRQRVPL